MAEHAMGCHTPPLARAIGLDGGDAGEELVTDGRVGEGGHQTASSHGSFGQKKE